MFNIQEELDKLPKQPGVYLMHDKDDNIIYVGKAVNLFNRVRSYFRIMNNRTPKIERMISQIDHFEYICVDSDLEAFVLENNLIKEYNPKYNTLLKDSKTYPYIKVTVDEPFPRILFTRRQLKDKAKYFGPYVSAQAVSDMIKLLNSTYQIRTCNHKVKEGTATTERPCLNFHMGRCLGPCMGTVKQEEYRENVTKALDFLSGNDKTLVRTLKEKMEAASEEMNFEEAIKYRELLESAKRVIERQKITNYGFDDRDIIAEAHDEKDSVVQVFFVRNGKMIGREHHLISDTEGMESPEIISEFIQRFYTGTPYIPSTVMISTEIESREILEKWLATIRGGSCKIVVPKIGTKEKLVELAAHNAEVVLRQDKERIVNEKKKTEGALNELRELLGMENLNRLEAFDISNTNGFQNVGSMVVFEDGKPKKNDYRKFRIKSVSGPDDYSCMYEVLSRRFIHGFEDRKKLKEGELDNKYGSFSRFPDLILMDGGRGQVNICLKVLDELNISIPVCGMVKDDNHNTRGLYVDGVEIEIDKRSEGFKLITRVQDEAHRFAIEYHKSLREKSQVHSIFEDIPGIGPKRRRALMAAFESVEDIKNATAEEISGKADMPINVAEEVYKYFHKE